MEAFLEESHAALSKCIKEYLELPGGGSHRGNRSVPSSGPQSALEGEHVKSVCCRENFTLQATSTGCGWSGRRHQKGLIAALTVRLPDLCSLRLYDA